MLSRREVETLSASLSRLLTEAGRVHAVLVTFTEAPVESMTATVATSALAESLANLDEDLCLFSPADRLELVRPAVRRASLREPEPA